MSRFTQNRGFFDVTTSSRKVSLLPAQYDPATPSVDGLERSTNLLMPDYLTSRRLDHLPDDLYDKRPHSHLTRFLRALMGDSGAGGLRKRFLISRFQQAFSATHFYDLDRFYGAIFGTGRLTNEQLPFNPFTSLATGEEWDRVHTSDARFRERVFSLAKAIPMGGTRPGLKTAAEAVVGAPCEVIEQWQQIDWLHGHGYQTPDDFEGYTWNQVEALGLYRDVAAQGSWEKISGISEPFVEGQRHWRHFQEDLLLSFDLVEAVGTWKQVERRRFKVGRSINDRSVVIVRPLKAYPNSDLGRSEKAQDEQALRRVLNVLKPANARLRLDMDADGLYTERAVRGFEADSEYYEIVQHISPATVTQSSLYPLSTQQRVEGLGAGSTREIPRPPFTSVQGNEWNYANEVVAIRSYAEHATTKVVIDGNDFDRVTDLYGRVTEFSGEKGVLDPRAAEAGRLSTDTSLMSHPYAADRSLVTPHA